MNFETGRFVAGSGPEGAENARKMLAVARGRPRKGEAADGSRAKSLRLPDFAWTDLEALAKAKKKTVHRLLREMVAEYLYTQTWTERQGTRKAVRKPSKRAFERVQRFLNDQASTESAVERGLRRLRDAM